MDQAAGPSSYRVVDGVAVLTIDSPPVNALSHRVRIALSEGVDRALADADVGALMLICGGRTFFAGADVTEIGRPILPPLLADVMAAFEAATIPVVAAIHGTALGGGLEVALAAHYRVAVPSAVFGLPEVALGLLPGAGGTQRLPRLVGVAAAVQMIGLGQRLDSKAALAAGVIDAIVPEDALEDGAIAFARELIAVAAPLRRLRDLKPDLGVGQADEVFAAFRAAHPQLFVGVKAPEAVLSAIEAAVTLPFDEGLERERALSRELIAGPESAAQRHLFFAERAAAKLPGHEKAASKPAKAIRIVGRWRDMPKPTPSKLPIVDSGPADVTIVGNGVDREAYEALLAGVSGDGVIVATGHFEDLDAFAEGLSDPAKLVGLAVTRGVAEVVVGKTTAPEAALTVYALAKAAGWPAIFVSPSRSLVLARLAEAHERTIYDLIAVGASRADLGATGRAYGFAAQLLPADAGGAIDPELERRLLGPVLAEARAILDKGVAMRASDVDFAAVRAGLWPVWRGGPAFQAQRLDTAKVAAPVA